MNHLALLILFTIFALPIISWSQSPNEFTLNEVYNMETDGTIFMKTNDAEINIIGSSRDDVHVDIFRKVSFKGLDINSKKQDLSVKVKAQNGDLYISDLPTGSSWTGIGVHQVLYEITIRAPQTVNLEVKGDDDDYIVEGLDGSISMDISDGDIVLKSCEAENFDLRLDDGDVEIDQGQGMIYARLEDGDIEIKQGDFYNVDIEVDDGDIYLATKLDDSGKYTLRSEDGSIEMLVASGGGKFDISHDDGTVRASNAFQLISDREDKKQFQLAGGKAVITIETEDGRVALQGNCH